MLTKEQAYEMGRQAYKEGLPSIPLYNKEFWDLNMKHNHEKWKENINAYATGWLEAGGNTQNDSRKVFKW